MPDRILPSDSGIIDGVIYLFSGFYIIHGLCWYALIHPSAVTNISWFHFEVQNETVATWFVVLGVIIIVSRIFWHDKMTTSILMAASSLAVLFPGLLFLTAWFAGEYPRGLIPASLYLFLFFVLLWRVLRQHHEAKRGVEDVANAKREM